MKQPFDFNELTALCFLTHEQMQQRAAYSVNVALVTRNWLFGCYIAEFEQKGEKTRGLWQKSNNKSVRCLTKTRHKKAHLPPILNNAALFISLTRQLVRHCLTNPYRYTPNATFF